MDPPRGGENDARGASASDRARLLDARDDGERDPSARSSAVKTRARFSLPKLLGLNAFFLAYGAWISSFAVVTLPYESTAFFPDADAVALGGFMVIAGASQMSGPLAGYVSDRARHAHGRRRPLIVKGAMVVGPSLVALLWARTYRDELGSASALAPTVYYVAFAVCMTMLNVMYTAATGLVPDLVPDEQMGEANGVLAACSAAGACLSFMYTMFYPDVGNLYFFYIGLLVTCVPITCLCANEESTLVGDSDEESSYTDELAGAFSWRELATMYTISPTAPEQKSFFWLFVCRTLYYTGISAQVFLQYLLRDTALKEDGTRLSGHEPQQVVARLSFIGQIGGMLAAYPAGLLSDIFGRRPLIVLACAGIISVYIMFITIHDLPTISYVSAYYGAMNGMFLSVDYALAIDCLPSRDNAARWLAIWGVASFIGTSVGPTVYALILHLAPDGSGGAGAAQGGYDIMLLVGASWMVLCTAFLAKVDPNWRFKLPAR